jgi:hypothetical protein
MIRRSFFLTLSDRHMGCIGTTCTVYSSIENDGDVSISRNCTEFNAVSYRCLVKRVFSWLPQVY